MDEELVVALMDPQERDVEVGATHGNSQGRVVQRMGNGVFGRVVTRRTQQHRGDHRLSIGDIGDEV